MNKPFYRISLFNYTNHTRYENFQWDDCISEITQYSNHHILLCDFMEHREIDSNYLKIVKTLENYLADKEITYTLILDEKHPEITSPILNWSIMYVYWTSIHKQIITSFPRGNLAHCLVGKLRPHRKLFLEKIQDRNSWKYFDISIPDAEYHNSFVHDGFPCDVDTNKIWGNVILETHDSSTTSRAIFTEKTWRPIVMQQPFLMLAPQKNIPTLIELGFHTFNNYFPYPNYYEYPLVEMIDKLILNIEVAEQVIQDNIVTIKNEVLENKILFQKYAQQHIEKFLIYNNLSPEVISFLMKIHAGNTMNIPDSL